MTKAALDKMTKTMAYEFAKHKVPVRVNAIAPGVFPSEINTPDVLANIATEPYPGSPEVVPARRAG
jgi:NAD(P)-dependent dehydrogenase (short-subunit alcohol dehydrogenase family)